MHSSHPRPSGEPPEILVNTGPWRCPEFSSLLLQKWAGLAVFVCVSAPAPASRSSVVSTRPLSSHQTRGTQPCCHSAQAPQRLRFPLGLTEVFAVSHIVGIQHQPVYWSPCGFSLFPSLRPSLPPCFLFLSFFFFSCHNTPSLHTYPALILSNETAHCQTTNCSNPTFACVTVHFCYTCVIYNSNWSVEGQYLFIHLSQTHVYVQIWDHKSVFRLEWSRAEKDACIL